MYPSEQALAQTYNTPSHADPMNAVEEFRDYQRRFSNAEMGSHAISTRMEIPRARVRPWTNGAKPDVVHGIETAQSHGWLEREIDDETFAVLNRLVAGIYSGGSIGTDTFVPSFSYPGSAVEQQLRDDLESIGAGCQLVHSNSGNVEEFRPTEDASVLGRVLVALGAPQGPKAQTVDSLPSYLDDAPDSVRTDFVRVYVSNRGVPVDGRNTIQIMEERPARYLDALASLIASVTNMDTWRSKNIIRIPDEAEQVLELELD